MKKILLTLCISINLIFSVSYAAGEGDGDKTFVDESVKDVSTIAGIAAGGAILGLSTLSFVQEPGDHLKNIVVGGAIGIIIGVAVVAYSQAGKSASMYQTSVLTPKEFNTRGRMLWHSASNNLRKSRKIPSLGYSFTF